MKTAIDRVAFTLFQIEDTTRARSFYEEVLGLNGFILHQLEPR